MRIKKQRDIRDWKQKELADKVGINNSVLSRIESGKRPVEDFLLIKFSNLFGVSTDYLTGMTNSTNITDIKISVEDLSTVELIEHYQKLNTEDQQYVLNLMKRLGR